MPELKKNSGSVCLIENVALYFSFLVVLLSNSVTQLQWQALAVQISAGFLVVWLIAGEKKAEIQSIPSFRKGKPGRRLGTLKMFNFYAGGGRNLTKLIYWSPLSLPSFCSCFLCVLSPWIPVKWFLHRFIASSQRCGSQPRAESGNKSQRLLCAGHRDGCARRAGACDADEGSGLSRERWGGRQSCLHSAAVSLFVTCLCWVPVRSALGHTFALVLNKVEEPLRDGIARGERGMCLGLGKAEGGRAKASRVQQMKVRGLL